MLIDSMVDSMLPWWVLYGDKLTVAAGELETRILGLLDGIISQVKGILS